MKALVRLLPLLASIVANDAGAGTVVFFGNGIWTQSTEGKNSAQASLRELEQRLRDRLTPAQFLSLKLELAYNPTGIPPAGSPGQNPIRGLRDLAESYFQSLASSSSQFWSVLAGIDTMPDSLQQAFQDSADSVDRAVLLFNSDLAMHVARYKTAISGQQKVVVVAHSQGNYFANESYGNLTLAERNNFSIVSVATPDSFVAAQNPPFFYTTLCEDPIWLVPGALEHSVVNNRQDCGIIPNPFDWSAHLFLTSYLRAGSNSDTRVVDDLVSRLSFDQAVFTDWLSAEDYQIEFDQQVARRFYPTVVEGRNEAGQSQFRGGFVPFPAGTFFFFSHHGIAREFYDQRNVELTSDGFTQIWVQSFTDASGIDRYQATWVKRPTTTPGPGPCIPFCGGEL